MKTFHSGGRIGDLVYALWTMKALGGGRLIVSDFHKPNWSLEIARSMETFLKYQSYVKDVSFIEYSAINHDDPQFFGLRDINYDLRAAEDDYNPEKFPEWTGPHWPGNCHIAKRYAVHFGLEFDGKPWIEAPVEYPTEYVAFHAPHYRIIRSTEDWLTILATISNMRRATAFLNESRDLLYTASKIASAKVMLGAVSCGHAIAEGLGKPRLVEQADGCFNVNPTLCLNGMSNAQVVEEVRKYL